MRARRYESEAVVFRPKKSPRLAALGWGMALGDSLLSHGKVPHYHRRWAVSLPGSGWVRVVHARYGHQAVRCQAGQSPGADGCRPFCPWPAFLQLFWDGRLFASSGFFRLVPWLAPRKPVLSSLALRRTLCGQAFSLSFF